jgi:membrane-associated protease RseP (regulator of RpoE activity)
MPADEPRSDGRAGGERRDPARAEPVTGASPAPPVVAEEEDADGEPSSGAPQPFRWKVNLALFVATVVSVSFTGAEVWNPDAPHASGILGVLRALPSGWRFAVPLLAILLTHEFGHYIAARIHHVDASLPYFIPLPLLSPFGTMGAIISMRGRIRSRNALLDIGASGPLAGLCVAIPVLIVGLMRSPIEPLGAHGTQEGQCLLYLALKRLVVGPIPAGHDVFLSPTALAGWAGLFVTMLNLVTVAQLDGGHIAYALFGERQNRYARVLHAGLLLVFAYNVVIFVGPVVARHDWSGVGKAFGTNQVLFWLVWYVMIHVIRRFGGDDHPPTEPGELSPVRKGVAVLSLVMFALLFMPTPWGVY